MDENEQQRIQISYVFWNWMLIATVLLTGFADISGMKKFFDVSVLLCFGILTYLNLHNVKKKTAAILFSSLPFIGALALLSEELLDLYGYKDSRWFGYIPGIIVAAVIIAVTVQKIPAKSGEDFDRFGLHR